MTSRRQSRREDVQRRLKALSPESKRCIVLGCSEPTRASSGDGFDKRLCRRHAEHLSTHGSAFRKTYTAKELAPGRTKAKAWPALCWVRSWGSCAPNGQLPVP